MRARGLGYFGSQVPRAPSRTRGTACRATYLLDGDPPVGFGQRREGRAADGDGQPCWREVGHEREASDGGGAIAHVEGARAIEGHAAVGILGAAGDPAGDGDPLAEADEAGAVELQLQVTDGAARTVRLHAEAEGATSELDAVEARAGREHARTAGGHDVGSDDR